MSAPRQRLCWAFILTPGSQNGRAARKMDSGMILCHLAIFQVSRVTAGDLPLDTQQVSGRAELRTQVSLIQRSVSFLFLLVTQWLEPRAHIC